MGKLHSAPSAKEKLSYIEQNKGLLYALGLFSLICLVTGMGFFAFSHPGFFFYLPFVVLLTVYLGISYFIGIFGKPFCYLNHVDVKARFERAASVSTVDIYLPCAGEPLDVLENTYRAVSLLDWEAKQIYVLDDRGNSEIEALAKRYNFHYIARPNRGELKKAGNLRYAFARTGGEFILILDADFAPRHDFLRETMPYFYYDTKIAVIQTPQLFVIEQDHTHVQKGAAYIQELFYRLVQVNRNTWGASICVGTNAVYRRVALEPFGGTAPIGYSEDLHTGFMLVKAGWKLNYIPVNLAKGLCPDNLYSFFTQQYRWCLGSFTLFMNPDFWRAKLPTMVRLCYLSGMLYYTTTAVGVFFTPLPGLLMVWLYPEYVFWYNLIFAVPSLIYGTLCLAWWSKAPFGSYSLTMRTVSYWAYYFAIFDKTRGDLVPWVPTGAHDAKVGRYKTFWYTFCGWSTFCFIVMIAGCIYHMKNWADYNFYPNIALAFFHQFLFMKTVVEEGKNV